MLCFVQYIHACKPPNVLQDRGASQLVGRTKFVGADDSIILEDESARMKLRGESLPIGQLVTGVVMAVRGVAASGGDFQVNVWFCYPPYSSISLASQLVINSLCGQVTAMPVMDMFGLTMVCMIYFGALNGCWHSGASRQWVYIYLACPQCHDWCRHFVLRAWLLKRPDPR